MEEKGKGAKSSKKIEKEFESLSLMSFFLCAFGRRKRKDVLEYFFPFFTDLKQGRDSETFLGKAGIASDPSPFSSLEAETDHRTLTLFFKGS